MGRDRAGIRSSSMRVESAEEEEAADAAEEEEEVEVGEEAEALTTHGSKKNGCSSA